MVGAMCKAASSQLVVARVFMEQARKNRRRHHGAYAVVGKGCAIAFSVGVPSLSPGFWIISRLFNSSENAIEGIGAPIKNAGSRQPEFLAYCERRKLLGVLDGSVIRQDLENAILDGSCFFL